MQAGLETLLQLERAASPEWRAFLAVRFTFQRTIGSREAWRLSVESLRSFKPKNRVAAIRRRDKYQSALQQVIDDVLAARSLPSQDRHLVPFYIFGISDGISRWYSPGGRLSEEQIVNDATRFVMRSLGIPEDASEIRGDSEFADSKA